MNVSEFNYNLPEELIAQTPLEKRDESRLMVLNRKGKTIEHKTFKDIIDYLQPGDCLVRNNTKVLPARIYGNKETGAKVEFLLLNNIAIFIFSPYEGVQIYGSRNDLFKIAGPYTVTAQQLFYQFNITLKYFSIIPMALLFMVATNPSEFAASLNKIGVSYKIAYSVSIALRYIPDVQRDYQDISFAQQARGIDMSKKEKLTKRIKNSASILMPLIFSSLDRIEAISSAMELRAFGSNKKRTWYNGRPFKLGDYITILVVSIILIIAIMATISNGGRFYNPFI